MQLSLTLFFIVTALLVCPQSDANHCRDHFQEVILSRRDISRVIETNRIWEQTANVERYRQNPGYTEIDFVSPFGYRIAPTSANDRVLPGMSRLEQLLGNQVAFPLHPYNTYQWVPGFNSPVAFSVMGYLSSSRSIVFPDHGISIKVATNYPNPILKQKKKTRIAREILYSRAITDWIFRRDQLLGPDTDLVILPDIASISFAGRGALIRDIEPILDGHFYMHGFSIPFLRPDLLINFSERLGKVKAKILLRYGMQMKTPNWQNMMQQLVRMPIRSAPTIENSEIDPLDLLATEKIILKDTTDWVFINELLEIIGEKKPKGLLRFVEDIHIKSISTGWSWPTTIKLLVESGVTQEQLSAMEQAHDLAYLKYIFSTLYITPTQEELEAEASITVQSLLTTQRGRQAYRNYHSSRRRTHN